MGDNLSAYRGSPYKAYKKNNPEWKDCPSKKKNLLNKQPPDQTALRKTSKMHANITDHVSVNAWAFKVRLFRVLDSRRLCCPEGQKHYTTCICACLFLCLKIDQSVSHIRNFFDEIIIVITCSFPGWCFAGYSQLLHDQMAVSTLINSVPHGTCLAALVLPSSQPENCESIKEPGAF